MRELVKPAAPGDIRPKPNTARRVMFPELKPSRKPISLRLPSLVLNRVKLIANRRGVPYQTMLNDWIAERSERERMVSG
jgi:predicted DNA binding CopG/RHH family protein